MEKQKILDGGRKRKVSKSVASRLVTVADDSNQWGSLVSIEIKGKDCDSSFEIIRAGLQN